MVESHRYCLLFSTFIREHWGELKAFTARHSFDRNQVVYFMGDPAEAVYLIESGRVKIVRVSPGGKEKITDIYQKGDLFGEVCLCETSTRTDQAVALERVTVASFDVRELLKLLQERPELTLDLLLLFCARLVECQEQIATLAFNEVDQRLAKEMLRLSRLPGNQRDKEAVQLAVYLTHQELADLVNTTRENITALMNQFRRQGLLAYSRRKIRVFPGRLKQHLKQHRS